MDKDFYKILGVSKTASDAEIKAAYRKKALEWHPDRNKTTGATDKFKEVNEAYEVLSDSQKRQTYDQFGSAAFQQGNPFGGGGSAGGFGGQGQGPFNYTYRTYGAGQNPFEGADFGNFSDPFEIFEQFFGGGFSTGGAHRRARRSVYSLNLTFMEAIKGVERTVDINGKSLKIKIPAGVDEGSRVRFADFDIVVSVVPDKTFSREGLNIIVEAEVDFSSATLGETIEVMTIDGPVSLKVPAGTQPDTVMRLRGRGVKDIHSNRIGDEYVRIKIKIPTKLTNDQKRLLEQYRTIGDKKREGWF